MKKLNDVIKEQRIIVFDSEITKSSMEKKEEIIISYIREDMEKPIRFVVLASCPGGQTQHVEYLHDYCKALNLNVEVYIIGLCFSAAILILGIAQKEKRFISTNSKIGFHAFRVNYFLKDIENVEEQIIRHQNLFMTDKENLYKYISKNFGISDEEILRLNTEGEKYKKYVSAEEAVKMGLVGGTFEKLPFL
ncbi:ATP-dependent Clp protease proteolytic subunit [Candidatus Nomurabacteria bacterium]|nr:ATP-dependent Clp protease proteolytic subunit [Candidatus Nomurabacteria bacterium]